MIGEASAAHDDREPDLLLLDVMLTDSGGRELCRETHLRSDVPVIILTIRGEEVDGIVGLRLGARNYLVKPFNARKLVAQLPAIKRVGRGTGAARKAPVTPGEGSTP